MDAVMDLLARKGLCGLTLDGVVAAAGPGVGKVAVGRAWPEWARLIIEALWSRYAEPRLVTSGNVRTDLKSMIDQTIRYLTAPSMAHVLTHMATSVDQREQMRDALARWLGPGRAHRVALLYAAAGRAELPHNTDVAFVLDVIAGTVLWRFLTGDAPDSTLADQLVTLLLDNELPRQRVADTGVL